MQVIDEQQAKDERFGEDSSLLIGPDSEQKPNVPVIPSPLLPEHLPIRADPPESASKLTLLTLPNELLDHIFVFLDRQAPSEAKFVQLPTSAWTQSSRHDLKTMSTLSHRLRPIVLPRLYRYARLNPSHLTDFIEFIQRADLVSNVVSIVAHLQGPLNHVHPAWWCTLLNKIPATRFVIGCAPHILGEVANIPLNLNDTWAFNVPYQYLELRQSVENVRQRLPFDDLPSLLGARRWQSLKVNEGSSIASYTSYEYFLKKPPSLLSNIQRCLSAVPTDPTPEILESLFCTSATSVMSIENMLAGLEEFSFVAVFPFYNHVDDILKCIRRMTNLRKLFIKLCPEPNSTVLNDEVNTAKGHIDLNDPWSEITTAYALIAHTVQYLHAGTQLQTVVIDDMRVEGIAHAILSAVREIWDSILEYDGDCTWTKTTSSKTHGDATGAEETLIA